MAVWNVSLERRAALPPSVSAGHVGLGPRLIDENKAGGIDFSLVPLPPGTPARDIRTVLLGREDGFF